jgi:hypothetical protein
VAHLYSSSRTPQAEGDVGDRRFNVRHSKSIKPVGRGGSPSESTLNAVGSPWTTRVDVGTERAEEALDWPGDY